MRISLSKREADISLRLARPIGNIIMNAAKNRKIICEVSDITSQIMAVKSGVCIGALPCFIADYEPKIWLVIHADLRSSPLS